MEIRKATARDFPALIELCRLFILSPYAFDKRFLSLSKATYPAFASDMLNSPSSLTLAAIDGVKIVGFITFCMNQPISEAIDKNTANILLLAVNESHRNKGIGKTLLNKALGLLFTLGAEIITVGTDIYNLPAIHVYESAGFKTAMAWHIFRYYAEDGRNDDHVLDEIDIMKSDTLELFTGGYQRPVSLLKEKMADHEKLTAYLLDNFRKGILKGNTAALQYFENNEPAGLITYSKDEIARKTLQIDRNIYKILDLIVLQNKKGKGIEKKLLQDCISRLCDYSLIEFWIEASNAELIQTAEDSGFRLSYTGLSLHYSPPLQF